MSSYMFGGCLFNSNNEVHTYIAWLVQKRDIMNSTGTSLFLMKCRILLGVHFGSSWSCSEFTLTFWTIEHSIALLAYSSTARRKSLGVLHIRCPSNVKWSLHYFRHVPIRLFRFPDSSLALLISWIITLITQSIITIIFIIPFFKSCLFFITLNLCRLCRLLTILSLGVACCCSEAGDRRCGELSWAAGPLPPDPQIFSGANEYWMFPLLNLMVTLSTGSSNSNTFFSSSLCSLSLTLTYDAGVCWTSGYRWVPPTTSITAII